MAQPRYPRYPPYGNPFLSRYEQSKRKVINIDELLAEKDTTVHLGEHSAYSQRGNR
jgi:hypothetical protein